MTLEEKNLLLKDLCGRLPYGVKVESVFINPDTKEHKSCGIEIFDATNLLMIRDGLGEFKPYLFPLSSMSEELKEEYQCLLDNQYSFDANGNIFTLQDFYCKYHIDYRGLIPIGLGIDARRLNIY